MNNDYISLPSKRHYDYEQCADMDAALANAIDVANDREFDYLEEVLSYELGAFYYGNKAMDANNDR